jgi:hypothetical protein
MATRNGGGCAFVFILACVAIYLNELMGEYRAWGWTVIAVGITSLYAYFFLDEYRIKKMKERERTEARCSHGILGARRDFRLCEECRRAEAARCRC